MTGASKLAHASSLRGHRALRTVAVAPIRAYQRLISPALPRRCKYHPTCSAYAVQAVQSYGILRGSVLAAWRLLRCNPFSHGGYDPVSAQSLFRPRPGGHPSP
jgi:putative membrane protein insertion efficiency factor